jgi:hypothetical protein
MKRERALKVVLVVVGLIFSALVYPLTMFVRQESALAMMLTFMSHSAFSCCWLRVTHRRIAA